MRFGATVLLFVCLTACVAAFPMNLKVVKKHTIPPQPANTNTNFRGTRTEDEKKWPFGFMEFVSLYAKCREWWLWSETNPSEGEDAVMGTLPIACNSVSAMLKEMENDVSTEENAAAFAEFNEYFPLFQCTNLQIDRERLIDYLDESSTDTIGPYDPFLEMTDGLAEICKGVFEKYKDVYSRRFGQMGGQTGRR